MTPAALKSCQHQCTVELLTCCEGGCSPRALSNRLKTAPSSALATGWLTATIHISSQSSAEGVTEVLINYFQVVLSLALFNFH